MARVRKMQTTGMARGRQGERGAALIVVLLFMVLALILVASMFALTQNEIVIAGRQRDNVRALENAQAGLQEAIRRMQEGRPYVPGFTSAISPTTTVTIVQRQLGTNSAYQEIRAQSTVGRSLRRLSALVLQNDLMFPPNVMFGHSVRQPGFPSPIPSGDIYSQTWVALQNPPSNPNCSPATPDTAATCVYAATAIRCGGSGPCNVPWKFTRAQAVAAGQTTWYPGTRLTESEVTALGQDIAAQTRKCPAGGGGLLPGGTITGTFADTNTSGTRPVYGFDTDDPAGAPPPQAVTTALPCGLPYKYVSMTFNNEPGDSPATYTRIFKVIVFEQWFRNYWTFDEPRMRNVRTSSLITYPQYGAIPPFPDVTSDSQNYTRVLSGGGAITGDIGCKHSPPAMSCSPAVDRPVSIFMGPGNWTISSTMKGHGSWVIEGNLTILQPFEFWGTIIVKGQLNLTSGPDTVHGGLVVREIVDISSNLNYQGGGSITGPPLGRAVITGKSWWER